ncbi:MAG: hypothetical protein ACKV2U_29780 [Bryobacteraceae bacterium]
MATKKKARKPDAGKTVRRVARNVVGIVKAARAIEPDTRKKKPKYKKAPDAEA